MAPAPVMAALPPPAPPTDADVAALTAAFAACSPSFPPRPLGGGGSSGGGAVGALPELALLRRSPAAAAWLDPHALLRLPAGAAASAAAADAAIIAAGVTPAALATSFGVDCASYLVPGGAAAADDGGGGGGSGGGGGAAVGPCMLLLSTLYVPLAVDEEGVLLGATVYEEGHNMLTPLTGGAWAMPPAGRFAYDLKQGTFLLGGVPPVPSAAHGRAVTYNAFELLPPDGNGFDALRWTETRLTEPPPVTPPLAHGPADDGSPTWGDGAPHDRGRGRTALYLTDRSVALMRRTDAWPATPAPVLPDEAAGALAAAVGGLGTFGVSAVEDDGRGGTRLLPATIYTSATAGVGMTHRLRVVAAAAAGGRVHPGALRLAAPSPPPTAATGARAAVAPRDLASPRRRRRPRTPPRVVSVLGGVAVAPAPPPPPPPRPAPSPVPTTAPPAAAATTTTAGSGGTTRRRRGGGGDATLTPPP
ncbi:hypothetical protein I4F81_008049 [Pyropia yezoensis]|uniref:Uncharacterized protein n=1 Tax=Pyropia yezoensis TaxID=2788 RepID=A0ACC3C6X6_PYRYE|nr:hypothetical protein I4F81_008049 [Neopyropia yezoensis]